MGSNYGWIFTAYGIAGIAGPQLAGFFKDAAEAGSGPKMWMAPFIIAGLACLAGAVIMSFTRPPGHKIPQKKERAVGLMGKKAEKVAA